MAIRVQLVIQDTKVLLDTQAQQVQKVKLEIKVLEDLEDQEVTKDI